MSRMRFILLGILLIGLAGCGRTQREGTEQPPPPAQQQAAQQVPENAPQAAQPEQAPPENTPQQPIPPAARPKQVQKRESVPAAPHIQHQERQQTAQPTGSSGLTPAQTAPQTQPPKGPQIVAIPSGTKLQVRLQNPLDTAVNKSGDTFRAILDKDVEVDGKVIAARGSILEGKLSQVARSGRIEGRASMALQLTNLQVGDESYPIQTEILSFQADSTKKQDATKVGVGAGLGAVIGAIAGGGKGAAIGAAAGAGAGGATVAATRGKEIQLAAEHKLNFALSHDVSVKLQ